MFNELRTHPMQAVATKEQAEFNAAFDLLAKGKYTDKALAAQVIALFGNINKAKFAAGNSVH